MFSQNVLRVSSMLRSLNRSAGISETVLLELSITDSLLASGERERVRPMRKPWSFFSDP